MNILSDGLWKRRKNRSTHSSLCFPINMPFPNFFEFYKFSNPFFSNLIKMPRCLMIQLSITGLETSVFKFLGGYLHDFLDKIIQYKSKSVPQPLALYGMMVLQISFWRLLWRYFCSAWLAQFFLIRLFQFLFNCFPLLFSFVLSFPSFYSSHKHRTSFFPNMNCWQKYFYDLN